MAERLAGREARVYHESLATLNRHRTRNRLRENLFLAKKRLDEVGFSVPESMKGFEAAIGWPEKAVMVPARRIRPSVFAGASDDVVDELNDRFSDRYVRTMERMLIDASLRHGVSFGFTTPGDILGGDPEVVVSARSALEATAAIDRRTLKVTSGLEVIDRDTKILYVPGEAILVENQRGELRVTNRVRGIEGRVSCATYAWGRSLDRLFGRSRITRPVMDLSGQAIRTMLRQEVHAEHFSSPQRILEGARASAFRDADGKMRDALDIATGAIWGIPDFYDEETGEWRRANLKQINAASMQPHTEQLRSIAMMFSGETGIPVGQLGIIQDNPSSADAMRAAETDLNTLVEAELPSYEDSRSDLAQNVFLAAHGPSAIEAVRRVKATFLNPATTSLSAAADWATKFVSANPWAAESDVLLEMWGFSASQLERLRSERRRLNAGGVLQQLLEARRAQGDEADPDGQ